MTFGGYINLFEKKERSIVFTFGRFNPPHTGHQKLVDTVVNTAKRLGYDHAIYPSHSSDPKKNPLHHNEKVHYLRRFFRNANIIDDKNATNPFAVAKYLSNAGYRNVILVVGGDRVNEMKKLFLRYINSPNPKTNLEFTNFDVVSAGKRDPDADDISGMSASKMRLLVQNGDYEGYLLGLPRGFNETDAESMFKLLRKRMGIREEYKRDYKAEYKKYHGKPEQIKRRASRVLARRKLMKAGKVRKGDGKDVEHKDGNPLNNSDANLRPMDNSKNRSKDNNKWRNEHIMKDLNNLVEKNILDEEDKKPLTQWFDKFEAELKKLGITYSKSNIDPVEAMDLYYDKVNPKKAARQLATKKESYTPSSKGSAKMRYNFTSHNVDEDLLNSARDIMQNTARENALPESMNPFLQKAETQIRESRLINPQERRSIAENVLNEAVSSGIRLTANQIRTYRNILGV